MSNYLRVSLLLLVGLPWFLTSSAPACNVPVFRYALERWPGDPYEVVIFHRGPLSSADQALVARLQKHSTGDGMPANLHVEVADVDRDLNRGLKRLYDAQKSPELPWMVVHYPATAHNHATVWAGRLDETPVRTLLDSPLRREVVKRLTAGESAVWVLLECGDKQKDDAAAEVLQARLPKLKTLLKLPELTDSPADKIATDGPPLKIAFSLLRLGRDNADEQMLIRMLLYSEEDLPDRKDPMVFPVFGRGRALEALIGKGITDDNIDAAGAFLVGPCSCQVKRLNPGTDLLVMADWDSLIEGRRVKTPEPPPLRSLFDFLPPETLSVPPRLIEEESVEVLSVPPRAEELASLIPNRPSVSAGVPSQDSDLPPASSSNLSLLRNIGLAVLAGVVILGAYALVLRGKSTR